MQYLLTETEYKQLKRAVVDNRVHRDLVIAKLCQRIANNEPVKNEEGESEPFGCCYHALKDGDTLEDLMNDTEGDCDRCPVYGICTLPPSVSK